MKTKSEKIILSFYIYLFVIRFIPLFILPNLKHGVISSFLLVIYVLYALFQKKSKNINLFDLMIIVFIFYNIIMTLLLPVLGYSISIGLGELATGILPIILYFYGKTISNNVRSFFEKTIIISTIFLLSIGLWLYYVMPNFYIEFLENQIGPGFYKNSI